MNGFLISYPISEDELAAIESYVATADVFVTHFSSAPNEVYSIRTYLEQHFLHETGVRLFVDRQIISYLKQLATGRALTAPERKLCSAIMCFAILAKIEIEPNIGIHEYADSNGDAEAWRDLCILRHADNVDFHLYHSIFKGLADSLPITAQFPNSELPPQEHSFTKRLRFFSFSYAFLLQIASLEKAPIPPADKMLRYLDWMYNEYLFGAPAVLFGNIFLSPSRQKRMIKNINSADRLERLAGVRNASWDLTYIQQWLSYLKKQQEAAQIWIACSNDRIVTKIARLSIATDDARDDVIQSRIREMMAECWGATDGGKIYGHYRRLASQVESPNRPNRDLTESGLAALRLRLEGQI